jgi:glyoxylase-like metal-dependent hydrolase (beta-lactamase superfamily II)
MSTETGQSAHRFMIGTAACAVVSDGTNTYRNPMPLLFENALKADLDPVLRAHDIDPDAWNEWVSPYSALLIDTGQRRILVDTGAGGRAPTNGKLLGNLRAEGVDPAAIETVLLTHGHPDHIGGTLDADQRPAFPNARYVLWRDEWQFWTSTSDPTKVPVRDVLKDHVARWRSVAQHQLIPVELQLELLDRDTEVAPGVKALAAAGHTPGHLVVEVTSQGEQLMWTGDALLHPVTVSHPEWYGLVDLRPEQAVATRLLLLARAADQDMLVHAAHFPWPGLGRVRRQNSGFRWEPID